MPVIITHARKVLWSKESKDFVHLKLGFHEKTMWYLCGIEQIDTKIYPILENKWDLSSG
jgi:hypothetical protein